MKRLSIGVRLTLWYLAIFALGELVFGAGMWVILRNNLLDLVDDSLESQVDDLKTFLAAQKKNEPLSKIQEAVKGAYGIEHSGDFLDISTATGDLVYRAPFLQAHQSVLVPIDQIDKRTFRIRHAEGQHLRFIYQKLDANGQAYVVALGANADDAIDTLHLFRGYLLMFAPALLLVAALVGYWMSRRALSPTRSGCSRTAIAALSASWVSLSR